MFISENTMNTMNNLQFLGLNQQEKIKDELRVPSKVICHLIGPVSICFPDEIYQFTLLYYLLFE